MEGLGNTLIDSAAQCWVCPIFDRLFAIISNAAAAAYEKLTFISVVIFSILLAFYILNSVWQNLKNGSPDPFYQKSIKPILIKSLIALSLLSVGLILPRLISTIVFEPAAELTYRFSESMLESLNNTTPAATYTSVIPLDDSGFFNPKLRDTILKVIETSVSNFQVYIKVGIGIMDAAFSVHRLLGIGALIKHIMVFFIGLYLTYQFGKLFVKYSFCFMDIIVAMALFAFFFPLSLIFFIFKDGTGSPGWMKKLGGDLGSGQTKKLVNTIVSVAATILTYTIIMLIIAGFLRDNNVDPNALQSAAESFFDFDLDNSNVMEITVASVIVLVYVLNYIAEELLPEVKKKILDAFGVHQEDSLSKETGENAWKLTSIAADNVKNLAKNVIMPKAPANATPGTP